MALDAYSPCPCGSGEKYKWCCQKVEPYAEKALRLLENGQTAAALTAIDEGLRKVPDSSWLLVRKAAILAERGQTAEAHELLERVLASQPQHAGARGLMTHLKAELQGPDAAVAEVQRALASLPAEKRATASRAAQVAGSKLIESSRFPGALKHFELALRLRGGEDQDPELAQALETLCTNPGLSPWLRNDDRLSGPPPGLSEEDAARFREALDRADEGLWSEAAALFQSLAAHHDDPEIERNLGFCRLWLGDTAAAVDAFRRCVRAWGETTEAVDLEALGQAVEESSGEDLVEQVQMTWTLRNREALLAALRASDRVEEEGVEPAETDDADDPEGAEVVVFQLLDRPKPPGGLTEQAGAIPRIAGRVLVGTDEVALEGYDDGQLDALTTRFVDLAGPAIPPAQPRTQVLGRIPRHSLAMRSEWWLPADAPEDAAKRLYQQERSRLLREVWPETPVPFLGGRSPRKAAADGDARVPLRAAVSALEMGRLAGGSEPTGDDFATLRSTLNLPDEPEIGPEADVETVQLARLHRVAAERLDDAKLATLYRRARARRMLAAIERVARAIIERPAVLADPSVGPTAPFADLANLAIARGAPQEAADWVRRGRETDPQGRGPRGRHWDILELRMRSQTEPAESWVPQLAVLMQSTSADRETESLLLSFLVELGLIELMPHPDQPGQVLMDTRRLQAIMQVYGPRITTATGELGVSATGGPLWTPESATGGATTPGGIWTPGGASQSGGEKKLILPGR